jgi:DNA modification methylase
MILNRLHEASDMKVLGPFAGVGTTGLAALRHGCDAVLIELNSEYCIVVEQRLAGEAIGTFD